MIVVRKLDTLVARLRGGAADLKLMRLGKTILGMFVALAMAVPPLGSFAHAKVAIPSPAAVSQMVDEADPAAQPAMAAMDAAAPMDDCCLPHGKAGDPCSSAACCAAHCTAVTPLLTVGFVYPAKSLHVAPLIRDQVFASTIGSPPFRPPRT